MAPSSEPRIKYTTKYSAPQSPMGALPDEPYMFRLSPESSADLQVDCNDYPPIIELVTVFSGANHANAAVSTIEQLSYTAGGVQDVHLRGRYLIIHSEKLARIIKDVIRYYPGQILTGSIIAIHEPFACLMHHMDDFESRLQSETQSVEMAELRVLLEFVRPLLEKKYLPARKRLFNSEPTVRFQDMWILMKPGSLAYVQRHGQWLGCVIEGSKKATASPPRSSTPLWLIDWWLLQSDLPFDRLGCVPGNATIEQFDGEMLITDLPIIPAEIFDAHDSGERRRQFENRGSKICDLLCGGSRYMFHDGDTLDRSGHHFTGRILLGGMAQVELYPKHDWSFEWLSPIEALRKSRGIATVFDPKIHSRESLTKDQLVIITPCLSAFRIPENKWAMINVDNVQPLGLIEDCPPPFISEHSLASMISLVNSVNSTSAGYASKSGHGLAILLTGSSGVGKTYTVDYIAMKSKRPLVSFSQRDLDSYRGVMEEYLETWSPFLLRWNALLVIDHLEDSLFGNLTSISFAAALQQNKAILFLTSASLDSKLLPHIELKVHLSNLNAQKRQNIWLALERKSQGSNTGFHLSRNAKEFLQSSDTQVNWNGHEMRNCFRTAIALARADHGPNSAGVQQDAIVEVAHFKEAMNCTHEFLQQSRNSARPGMTHPPRPVDLRPMPSGSKLTYPVLDDSDSASSFEDGELPEPASVTLESDSTLCIPSLNRMEWEAFHAAGENRELFRKTKFHAIDFLEGEPRIVMQTDSKTRRRIELLAHKTASTSSDKPSAKNQQERRTIAAPDGEAQLPERIRVNSPAIAKVFSELREEQSSGSFLMFRPFLSLLYYEQDFQDWVIQQEKIIKDKSPTNTEYVLNDMNDAAGKDVDSAALQEVMCLLSFIENHVKKKKQYLASSLCKSVAFHDLPLLFNPGDSVVTPEQKQAFRVVRVRTTRHRIKKPSENETKFWQDSSKAEYTDNPIYIDCVHVDFDGVCIGPVRNSFIISRFDGQKEVVSLPIYPLRYTKDPSLREKLIQRGRMFLELAAIKHMHYTGSTIGTREEIDSQVVIDFDEAISRHPEWSHKLKSTMDWLSVGLSFDDRLDGNASSESDNDKPSSSLWIGKRDKAKATQCVKECCLNETAHHDEYVGARRAQEYIASQMASQAGAIASPSVSVTIVPRRLKDFSKENALTDDDLLIMSYCVLGFALRSRKWYKLDMTYLSQVKALGEGEGFEQLVLPEGHGNLVKSMIRQHFRDKKLSAGNVDSSDLVRGKGRGLIMLLHGVPGVGKTSTAECIADLFRRPLFQITSGDLGTTAKEVEDTLEDNFNLASRWNSILLIDEADVFLGERTREDFARNSLVAVFLRMMEYYSGVLFLTTNRVGVFDEAFTSRVHISLYYPPLDRDSTRKIFEKNWERIQARYEKNARSVDIRVSEITEFALDYFDNNKDGRWNGRQIRNAFQSAIALAELDASGTDDLFNEADHGHPVVLGKKSFDTVAQVYKSFLAYLKQVYGADYARRARENLWRFDAFGAPRMPNALTTRLTVADRAPPPPGPERPRTGQYQQPSWYDYREPSYPYPPRQDCPERYGYDYSSQTPRGPPPEQQHYRETPRGMGPQQSGNPPPPTRPDDPQSGGYRDARGFSQPGPHPEWAGRGGGEAGSGGYQAPTRHDPQHSQAHYPSGSGHLSPFPGHDR